MLSYNYNGQDGPFVIIQPIKVLSCKNQFRTFIKEFATDVNAMFNNKSVDGGGSYSGMKAYVLRQPISGGATLPVTKCWQSRPMWIFVELRVPIRLLTLWYRTKLLLPINVLVCFCKCRFRVWLSETLPIYRIAGSYRWNSSKSTSFSDERSTGYLMDPVNTGMTGSINSESYSYQITNTGTIIRLCKEA